MTNFYTIGHSTHSIEDFILMLQESNISILIDVRSAPSSRHVPHFNSDVLESHLRNHGISYEHITALGGHRKPEKQIPSYINGLWTHKSFHNYADYAMTPNFENGLARLREIGHNQKLAYMCAETVWWRCHRRIITDHLIAKGETVYHILGLGQIKLATLTKGAKCCNNIVDYTCEPVFI
jgi:uncharacterized protein (DUF488 family)